MTNKDWYPEIMYEENEEGISSKIPFVLVPKDKTMPSLIYIFESRETGEYEPGLNGDPVPILEMDLHQYADMSILKDRLDETTYDVVRNALGLEKLRNAYSKGKKITENIKKNIQEKTKISP
jgi:hypothetical protein